MAPADYEIIVVDNCSTDATADIVRSKAASGPRLICVPEPKLGLSHARNTGLRQATADIIAFLDDDAVADQDWLSNIARAFAEFDPAVVCGPVEPIWGMQRPAWLSDDLLSVYSVVAWSEMPRPLIGEEWVVGANMAFSRNALGSDSFDARLGRIGAGLLCGEETELVDRIRQRNGTVLYDPRVRVAHHIHAARLARRWYLDRMVAQGCTDSVLCRESCPSGSLYVLRALKEIALTLVVPGATYVAGKSTMRRLGHIAEQIGKIAGRVTGER